MIIQSKLMKCAIVLGFLCLGVHGFAQERTAGGATELQMTWTSLSNMVKGVETKIDGANSLLNQMVICGKSGKVYAPSVKGGDSKGCLIGDTQPAVTDNLTAINNTLSNFVTCGTKSMVFNGKSCVSIQQKRWIKTGDVLITNYGGGKPPSKPSCPKNLLDGRACTFSGACQIGPTAIFGTGYHGGDHGDTPTVRTGTSWTIYSCE